MGSANFGAAPRIIRMIADAMEKEAAATKRIDMLYLVDSILQVKQGSFAPLNIKSMLVASLQIIFQSSDNGRHAYINSICVSTAPANSCKVSTQATILREANFNLFDQDAAAFV